MCSFSRQIFVRISDAERARTYENVIQNERNKGDREEDKTDKERKTERQRSGREEDEERERDDRKDGFLAGPKIGTTDFSLAICLQRVYRDSDSETHNCLSHGSGLT